MTENEPLMRNDIVYATLEEEGKKAKVVARIIRLHQHYVDLLTMSNTEIHCAYSQLNPIQVTEEILEDNGFEVFREPAEDKGVRLNFDDIQCFRQKDKENGCVQYGIDISRRSDIQIYHLRIECNFGDFTNLSKTFKYVHELQQAFRMCGLNDMADNFNSNEA